MRKGKGKMAQKTGQEKMLEIETKIGQLEMQKTRLENRLNEQERKKRTRRLIQVGAIFEKHFDIKGVEDAENVASTWSDRIKKNKDEMLEELLNQNRKLNQENEKLKKENKSLDRDLQRYKKFVKTFGNQVKLRMEALVEKLEAPDLYEGFIRFVFEPSKDYSNAEYSKDRKQEKEELAIENEKN